MGGFRGSLSSLSAPRLGALAIEAALERANCPKEAVDEVYMGAVLQVNNFLQMEELKPLYCTIGCSEIL